MHINCQSCQVRDVGCGDCVVSLMIRTPTARLEVDDVEAAALGVLASAGLVPPLRLATRTHAPATGLHAAAAGLHATAAGSAHPSAAPAYPSTSAPERRASRPGHAVLTRHRVHDRGAPA